MHKEKDVKKRINDYLQNFEPIEQKFLSEILKSIDFSKNELNNIEISQKFVIDLLYIENDNLETKINDFNNFINVLKQKMSFMLELSFGIINGYIIMSVVWYTQKPCICVFLHPLTIDYLMSQFFANK